MRTIRVKRTLRVSAEKAFDVIADHEGYTRFPDVRKALLVKPGTTEKNGVGAVREIELRGAWFQEEITAFERPRRLGYRIVKSKPPIDHQGGVMELTPTTDGVEIVWTSTFRITIPVIGGLLTFLAARRMASIFARGLVGIEELAKAAA